MSLTLLKECPNKPNCVSSVEARPNQHIEPIRLNTPTEAEAEQRYAQFIQLIADLPRATIIKQAGNYCHAEIRSKWFKFVDDLECILVPEEQVIHLRSAARVGYADFNVNRKRIEYLRQQFQNHDRNISR